MIDMNNETNIEDKYAVCSSCNKLKPKRIMVDMDDGLWECQNCGDIELEQLLKELINEDEYI